MVETPARVVRLQGDIAWVRVEAPASCGACGGKGCGASLYARMLHPREPEYAVGNPICAQPGERVVIGIEDGALLKAALSAYVLPLVLLLIGAVVGASIGEAAAVLGGLLGLALGLMRIRRQGGTGSPVILRRAYQDCAND
jgi:sigma-E factor negative regulatory protein RseC